VSLPLYCPNLEELKLSSSGYPGPWRYDLGDNAKNLWTVTDGIEPLRKLQTLDLVVWGESSNGMLDLLLENLKTITNLKLELKCWGGSTEADIFRRNPGQSNKNNPKLFLCIILCLFCLLQMSLSVLSHCM
jgi:hypothetical protein